MKLVLVALTVVAHRGPVDRGLGGGQVDLVQPGRLSRPRGGLEVGQRPAGVTAGQPEQVVARVVGERHCPAETALVDEGGVHHRADVLVGQRLQGEQQRAGQQRGDHAEERVLGGGRDQRHPAVLHAGEQRVLLGLGEPVNAQFVEPSALSIVH